MTANAANKTTTTNQASPDTAPTIGPGDPWPREDDPAPAEADPTAIDPGEDPAPHRTRRPEV